MSHNFSRSVPSLLRIFFPQDAPDGDRMFSRPTGIDSSLQMKLLVLLSASFFSEGFIIQPPLNLCKHAPVVNTHQRNGGVGRSTASGTCLLRMQAQDQILRFSPGDFEILRAVSG
eukprot:748160-Hanusia_phi.AAC.1